MLLGGNSGMNGERRHFLGQHIGRLTGRVADQARPSPAGASGRAGLLAFPLLPEPGSGREAREPRNTAR